MDKIYEYLKGNPQYVTALIVTFVLIIAACVLGYFINKYNLLKFMDKWFGKNKNKPPQTSTSEAQSQDGQAEAQNPEVDENEYGEQETAEEIPAEENSDAFDEDPPPIDETVIADAAELEVYEPDIYEPKSETVDEDKPKKTSRLSEMLRRSLESGAVDDYEADKKFTQTPKPAVKNGAETETKQPVKANPEQTVEFEGKWRILRIGNVYVAHLFNDKDLLLLKSQNYANVSGAKNAIETLKKNIKDNNFTVTVNKNKKFCFKLFSKSGRFICAGEDCETGEECKNRIEEVKRIAFKAEIIRG